MGPFRIGAVSIADSTLRGPGSEGGQNENSIGGTLENRLNWLTYAGAHRPAYSTPLVHLGRMWRSRKSKPSGRRWTLTARLLRRHWSRPDQPTAAGLEVNKNGQVSSRTIRESVELLTIIRMIAGWMTQRCPAQEGGFWENICMSRSGRVIYVENENEDVPPLPQSADKINWQVNRIPMAQVICYLWVFAGQLVQ